MEEKFKVEIVDSEVYMEEMKDFLGANLRDCSLLYSGNSEQLRKHLKNYSVGDLYLISETAFGLDDLNGPTIASNYIRLGSERDGKNPLIFNLDQAPFEGADPYLTGKFGEFEGGIIRYFSQFDKGNFSNELVKFLNDAHVRQISKNHNRTREDLENLAKRFPFFISFKK